MGGIGDALFGSSGEPSQVIDTNPRQFRRLRGPVSDALQNIISTEGGPQAQGPFAAQMTGTEGGLLDFITDRARQVSPGMDTAQQALMQTAGGTFLSPQQNPFLQDAIEMAQRPIRQEFEEQTMPRLRGEFTRAGQFVQPDGSSPFDMAAARAGSGLMDALGDVGTQMAFQNFSEERDRQLQAAQALPELDQATMDRAIQGLEAAALPRMIEQMGIETGLGEFERRMNMLMRALQLGGQLGQPQTQVIPGSEGSSGLLGGALGGVARGAGAALGGSLFSDRRIKTDVEYVYTRRDGLHVYDYTLAGIRHLRGLMADEVRRIYPQAMKRGPRELLMVDYTMVPNNG